MAPRLLPPLNIQDRVEQYTERSPGLHLSQITGDILIGLDPDRYGEKGGGPAWMNFWAGLLFERIIERAWISKEMEQDTDIIRPGEVNLDGVCGTPDAWRLSRGRPAEFKCTKKSCRQDITDIKFWHYWVQVKAYAKMLGVNTGELHVLFVNGNYSRDDKDPESGYVIKSWEDEWTDQQLDENWNMLLNHARSRGWLKAV